MKLYPLSVLESARRNGHYVEITLSSRSIVKIQAGYILIFLRGDLRCRICNVTATHVKHFRGTIRPCFERSGVIEILTNDHIIPTSKGGLSDPRNYRILCKTCNSIRSDRLSDIEVLERLPEILAARKNKYQQRALTRMKP